ncbi:MAG TPA: VCBS repeat-containing protein [Ardenticatenaceae bacterium]|nr:VCBS repeat-containing protein [Ardenticatenaceae bacterium]
MSILLLLITFVSTGNPTNPDAVEAAGIPRPVLKWQLGGCYTKWCEAGWYASPAVVDLDGDGRVEVVSAAYSIVALDGASGALEWRVKSGHDRSEPDAEDDVGRMWPSVVVADVDGDGRPEIATSHKDGYVSVYSHDGYFEPGWPQRPTEREIRGLAASDLDGDGSMEVVVSGATLDHVNSWVFEHDGRLRRGWPQATNSTYAYGVYNNNTAVGDLDGDGSGEVIVPSDKFYVAAYHDDGQQVAANPIYGGKSWAEVGVWESMEPELRGYGHCEGDRTERYRANFADGVSVLADVDGNGTTEVVVTGDVYDCQDKSYPRQYNGLYIFNADRSRFNNSGFDWRTPPVDTGAPLIDDYDVIATNEPNPAVADLDGDGRMEILYPSYDGRLHAFWLDTREHGNWPYEVYNAGEGIYRFGSEPAIADLNDDGKAEIIFASWTQKGSGRSGKLHILDWQGNRLHEVELPPALDDNWNGAMAAPTLADIDGDPDLEVVLNTARSGVVAYDLPGSADARVLWGTGRGNYARSGAPAPVHSGGGKRYEYAVNLPLLRGERGVERPRAYP